MFISRPNEELKSHIDVVMNEYENLKINKVVTNIINKLCMENKKIKGCENIIYDIFLNSLKLHDEGKKNPYFQSYIGNEEYKDYKYAKLNKHHAEISAIFFLIEMYEKHIKELKKRSQQQHIKDIIICLAYNIYNHHSSLGNLDKSNFIDNLIFYYEKNKEQFINIDISNIKLLQCYKNRIHISYTNPYTYYVFCKLNYSVLISCDFKAVYYSNNKESIELARIDSVLRKKIETKFNKNKVISSINEFRGNKDLELSELNKYRCEMFLESESNLINYKKNNLFYLEAPTGSGKSLTSLNLFLNLLDDTHDKLIYVAPFNNIIEQSYNVIKENLYENTVIINSNQEIFTSDDDFMNYDKDFLNMQTLNYPISLISHVRLFDILFSNDRFKNLMFAHLQNSVIILDEIQSYKNKLWMHIINALKNISELMNIKVIIMSATLPKMDKLLDDKHSIPNLITNRDYYFNFFKKRVSYNYDLLKNDNKNTVDEVESLINNHIKTTKDHRVLIECMTIKNAEEFYNRLKSKESEGFKVFKITAGTNNITREHIINIIQQKKEGEYINKKVILIGTQCIEAGVDIDMDVGFKNISILDGDEQFCGRICRNFLKKGLVYFFDVDNIDYIYKDDYRIEKTLKNQEYMDIFESKDFNIFYENNYNWLLNKEKQKYIEFKNKLNDLQYIDVYNDMKLIDSNTYSFIFKCQYEELRHCDDVLSEYINLLKSDIKYSQKQIEKSKITKELSKYTYSMHSYKFKNDIYLEKLLGFYIVEDAEKYFDNITSNGKLSKSSSLNLNEFVKDIDLFI